jgi:uncharacterized protein YdhG (YjbR/CyaY superfamily)
MPTVDDYLTTITPTQLAQYRRVRGIVKRLVPDAEETISYGVPTFKYKGTYLLYFGAFAHHMSLYPASASLMEAVPELEKFRVSKGTLRFTEKDPIPDNLIEKMVTHRLGEIK